MTYRRNNSDVLPEQRRRGSVIGLGVFRRRPRDDRRCRGGASVYRHIDTAATYGNEREVGEAIRRSGLDRNDVFIETSVDRDYGYDDAPRVREGARSSGTTRSTCWSAPASAERVRARSRRTRRSRHCWPTARFARSASATSARSTSSPLLAQVDVVPGGQPDRAAPVLHARSETRRPSDARHGILTAGAGRRSAASRPTATACAQRTLRRRRRSSRSPTRHGNAAAQVMLHWQIGRAARPIPKSVRPKRVAENAIVFGLELSEAELAAYRRPRHRRRAAAPGRLRTCPRELRHADRPRHELSGNAQGDLQPPRVEQVPRASSGNADRPPGQTTSSTRPAERKSMRRIPSRSRRPHDRPRGGSGRLATLAAEGYSRPAAAGTGTGKPDSA